MAQIEPQSAIARKLGYPRKAIAVEDRLYGAGVAELLDVIRNTDESVTTLMLFGHNPGLTELANHLGPRPIPNLPTWTAFCISGLKRKLGPSWGMPEVMSCCSTFPRLS